MKKILFYYDNFCGEKAKGGTEVATKRIATSLKETGEWKVFNAFRNKSEEDDRTLYSDVIKLSKSSGKFISSLSQFIRKNDIDVVVNMSRFFRHNLLEKSINKSGKPVKLIFMQHFAPGSERKKSTYSSGFHLLGLNPLNPLYWLRATVYPLIKLPRTLKWAKIYRKVYSTSARVILLSERYVDSYKMVAGITDDSKFHAIPNIFDKKFESNLNGNTANKEKRVLILSRMDEVQKRISLALKIWKEIEKESDLANWHLDIVGAGHDMAGEKRLAKKLGLKNVTFHGWQSSEIFLQKNAILMMTSEYEGLPLSIIEAQSFGCIPIAFNSFASLKDVVEDGKTGIIVENFGDVIGYAGKLMELMRDESKREEISEKAKINVNRFSSGVIASMWQKMLRTI